MKSDPQPQIGAWKGTDPPEQLVRWPADLPFGPNNTRWIPRRKAALVLGVRAGLLTVEEACTRYDLTREEYLSWEAAVDQHGVGGLRTTKVQQYRRSRSVLRA